MKRRFQIAVILFAWLLATGGQWHLIQSFAWGRMIAAYAKTMPLREAVRLTMTPDNMCGVCELVSAAQQQHGDTALPVGTSLDAKTLLAFQPAPTVILTAPPAPEWSLSDRETPASERAAPPLQPPRALV
ncbi:hypothetical protein CMV30_11375 [Nibricoccus aquaticus]|uniref:DUF2946 domain-containing protein n=1 Tax=Nibricoccus aquaticus TaxID=2576891 RepID=A0A290Q7U7_9BACT|nr:hypothetical protein [Nibricoccus aquaticus]ATC64503.1 hypothetical protein CMV30_11375 [Nibricoccus aquaticus]